MDRNGNSDGGGCLLLLFLVIGVIGMAGEALLIIGAAVVVICVIVALVSGDSTNETTTEKNDNNTTDGQAPKSQAPKSNITDKPTGTTVHIDRDAQIVQSFLSKYRVAKVPYPTTQIDSRANEFGAFACSEVLQSVKRLVNQRVNAIKQLNTCYERIHSILACPNCFDNKQKVKYLQENEETLKRELAEYNTVKNQMKTQKITLMNKHNYAFISLKNALMQIMGSKKIVGKSGVEFKTFAKMQSVIPGDLFVSVDQPIELNFGAYRFFLLPEVILVYDKASVFITALEPMAMVITSNTKKSNVYMTKEGYSGVWKHSDTLIADDSVKLSEGHVYTTWLHTKKDGGPDRRYSHNPMYQHRDDLYQYGEVTIQIGQYKAEYSFSSGRISEDINLKVRQYTSIKHEMNATPSLLRLLEYASKKKDDAHHLCVKYEQSNPNFICEN